MKVSISLSDELVRYIDDRVENRSRLIEELLQAWRNQQERQVMVEACLSCWMSLLKRRMRKHGSKQQLLIGKYLVSEFRSFNPMTFDKRRLIQCLGQVESNQLQEIQQILVRYLEL